MTLVVSYKFSYTHTLEYIHNNILSSYQEIYPEFLLVEDNARPHRDSMVQTEGLE